MSNYLEKAFSPASLGKLALKNRIIKAATYEGKTPDGVPGDLLLDFHKAIARGGTAMTRPRTIRSAPHRLHSPNKK